MEHCEKGSLESIINPDGLFRQLQNIHAGLRHGKLTDPDLQDLIAKTRPRLVEERCDAAVQWLDEALRIAADNDALQPAAQAPICDPPAVAPHAQAASNLCAAPLSPAQATEGKVAAGSQQAPPKPGSPAKAVIKAPPRTLRPLNQVQLLHYLRPLLSALAFHHGRGIIHSDLKADNLLICDNGSLRCADFGCAVLAADSPTAALHRT